MASKRVRKAVLVLLVVVPILVLAGSWAGFRWEKMATRDWAYRWGSVGNLLALVGLPLLVTMVVLGARLPWVERVFGLDRMLRAHQLLAKVVVCLFLGHALLRTVRVTMDMGMGWQWWFLLSLDPSNRGLLVGRLALYALLILSPLALVGMRLLSFRAWKLPHLLLYPVVAAGFAHAMAIGDDFEKVPFNVLWYLLVAVFAGVTIYRIVACALRKRRGLWMVESVKRETDDTTTLQLSRAEGSGPFERRRAGQFAVLRIVYKHRLGEPRPFTISCTPDDEQLWFTIKRAGAVSTALSGLRPRTRVLCEGPYGVFCPSGEEERNLVLIAGGVGVTPFLSSVRHILRAVPDARITLLWNNKTRADIFADEELRGLTEHKWLRVVHVLSREEAKEEAAERPPSGETFPGVFTEHGHVTAQILERHVNPEGACFYLCGPPKMQRFVLGELRTAFGVRASQVQRELFFW